MGVGIPKNIEPLTQFILQKTKYEKKRSDFIHKCVVVWEIEENKCECLAWPYLFKPSACYIFLVVSTAEIDKKQLLSKSQTPIEIGQMLFSIQFLQKYLAKTHKLHETDNKKQSYRVTILLYTGDSLSIGLLNDDDIQSQSEKDVKNLIPQNQFSIPSFLKSKAVSLFCRINNCIEQIGLFISLSLLNLVNTVTPSSGKSIMEQTNQLYLFNKNFNKSLCLEFVDLKLQHYQYLADCEIINAQLYGGKLKTAINLKQMFKKENLADGFQFVEIEQDQKYQIKTKIKQKRDLFDESLPFACEITQIQASKKSKKILENQDNSNFLLEELGIANSIPEKIEEFVKGLYLGTERVSRNYQILNDKKIKLIINCAPQACRNWFVNDIDYRWMFIPDPLKNNKDFAINIQCLIYDTIDILTKYFSQDHSVLLHCADYDGITKQAGSRSAALLIGILMVSLNIDYQYAQKTVIQKWPIIIPEDFKQQLKSLQRRRKHKPKQYRIFGVCSYSLQAPDHIVAKYLSDVQTINNIQGIQNSTGLVFIALGKTSKILIGPKNQYKTQHEKFAKEYIKKLIKYQLFEKSEVSVEAVEKTFRKQPNINHHQQLYLVHPNATNIHKSIYCSGYLRNEDMIFKYPILRPVWEKKKKDDAFYFIVKQNSCIQSPQKHSKQEVVVNIILRKGSKWVGFQEDEKKFLAKIIDLYLKNIPQDCILLEYQDLDEDIDKSLFDGSVFAVQP